MNDVLICFVSSTAFDRAAQGLAGAGRRLAEDLSSQLKAIVLSPQSETIAQDAAQVVDEVIVIDQGEYQPEPALNALTHACSQLSPAAVLFGNDTYSQEITPRLAHRLGGSAVGDVVEVSVHGNALRVARQVYGGKARAVIELKRTPAVLWTRSRSFSPANRLAESGKITELSLDLPADTQTRIIDRKRESQTAQRLEEARVIVSGGRGIGGPEPFNDELKPLADLLGAQLAASRAACDAGWVPPTFQVGQTGKKVTPDLYLAIAITGASQHMAGISEAKNIAAINTDPDAPIFKHCRFGIVEDYRKVVPLLRQKLIALQNSQKMNPAGATRQIYWNISHIWAMYVLLVPAFTIFVYGFYRQVKRCRRGTPAARFDQRLTRLKLVFKHALAQRRTARNAYAGLFHRFISYGFVILTIATTVVALDADFGTAIMRGHFYLYFQSLIVDLFGAFVLVGVGLAAARRYISRPGSLLYTDEATWILVLIAFICLQGFLLEGWRIAATNDPWASYSPIGSLIARASRPLLSDAALQGAHRFVWWFHLVLSFGVLAWFPYTKMMHVVTAPLNIYTAQLAPLGASLKHIDFEKTESFGVNSLAAFTWKDLLDLDACTECGRCTEVCPAHTVGKELSPRDIVLGLRDVMRNDGVGSNAAIIGSIPATSPVALWQCTTCVACMEACPVFIEQMPKIVDMRRFLVMEEAEFPESMQQAIMSLEKRGHPFSGTNATRVDWADGLDVKHISEAKDAEVLLWVGCGGALIERNQKVTRSTAQLLDRAGVKFAILGRDEKCSGDPARRIGNEFLFEMLAKDNVENLNKHNVKTIVTSCPHCFNAFRNEYPHLGGNFEVYHHSEYLARLVSEGRLESITATNKKVTFHDPCYLGRQNGIYDSPRQLVQIASKGAAVEMARSREKSFCCGGGGGMSFVDEPPDKRVNQERAREALATGADVLAVGCPFCMTMMEDGINARRGDQEMRVMDVAELLWEALSTADND